MAISYVKSLGQPENLLEMAFDEAKVRRKLSNLGDTAVTADYYTGTLGNRIMMWLKNDFNKRYRWEY